MAYLRTAEIRAKNARASTKEVVGYFALHYRVYENRGKAKDQVCDCGYPAAQWAHLRDTNPYDPANYLPMCRSCHSRYDHMERNFR